MTGKTAPAVFPYKKENVWPVSREYELLLQKETAYELGAGNKDAVNFTLVTTDSSFFNGDEVVVYGPDLPDIKGPVSYCRITMLLTTDIESDDEEDTETAYRAIQEMDFVKYHVFPKGFMIRTSSQNGREQVRVGTKALKAGMTFERVGGSFIRQYKLNENVRNVKVIFITAEDADFAKLKATSKKVADITSSLSKILEGMPTECGSCGLRDICEEVEGLKELHFGQKGQKK